MVPEAGTIQAYERAEFDDQEKAAAVARVCQEAAGYAGGRPRYSAEVCAHKTWGVLMRMPGAAAGRWISFSTARVAEWVAANTGEDEREELSDAGA